MNNRRDFLKSSAALAATTLTTGSAFAAPASQPNILIILADDLGYSDLGCYGSELSTPNLDKLAASGIQGSQFYNNPRCCPSRASIMTGLYPHQADMGHMAGNNKDVPKSYNGTLSAQTITIPEALKTVGYNTAMVGKWHLAAESQEGRRPWPMQRGFDQFWGMVAGVSVYYQSPHLMSGNDHLPPPPADQYLTDLWTDHAVAAVGDLAAKKKPFFLYTAYNAPHFPIQAPEDEIQRHIERYRAGWDMLRQTRHAQQVSSGLLPAKWKLSDRDPRVPAWEKAGDKEWEIRRMATYAAMIEHLDRGIGRILDAVDKAGIRDNTLIMFLSDNGGNAEEMHHNGRPDAKPYTPGHPCEKSDACGGNVPSIPPGSEATYQSIGIPWANVANTPFRLYKHFAHEGGVSSPFIASWPAVIKPGKKAQPFLGHETDLMATCLEVAGATYPKRVAAGPIPALVGESLVPIFHGRPRTRGPIFWEHEGNKALRDGQWKLVARYGEPWELYDMEADRTELHDLASAQPARVQAMSAQYDDWTRRTGVFPWPVGHAAPISEELKTPPYLELYQAPGQRNTP